MAGLPDWAASRRAAEAVSGSLKGGHAMAQAGVALPWQ